MKWEFCKHLKLVIFQHCNWKNQSCHSDVFQSPLRHRCLWGLLWTRLGNWAELMQRVGWLVWLFLFVKTSQAKEKRRAVAGFHFISLIFVPAKRQLLVCRKKQEDSQVLSGIAILCSCLFGNCSESSKYQWKGRAYTCLLEASCYLGLEEELGIVLRIYGTVSCCSLRLGNSEFLSLLIFCSIWRAVANA